MVGWWGGGDYIAVKCSHIALFDSFYWKMVGGGIEMGDLGWGLGTLFF